MAKSTKTKVRPRRCGTAVVELAVTLPVITFVVLGAIQASHMIQLKHSCHYVVDDMLRLALQDKTSNEELVQYGQQFCKDAELHGVDFGIRRQASAAMIKINATAPFDKNFAGVRVFPAREIVVSRSAYLENP